MKQERLRQTNTTAQICEQTTKVSPKSTQHLLLQLQAEIGNRATNKLLADRNSKAPKTSHRLPDKIEGEIPRQGSQTISRKKGPSDNNTGMSDRLKSNIEYLSGLSMDDVKVHYNSSKPLRLGALAYTQGTEIYLGPGQEKHLPHETWHVVQQKQGRVKPTGQARGLAINDDVRLENEADLMGTQAQQVHDSHYIPNIPIQKAENLPTGRVSLAPVVVQKQEVDAEKLKKLFTEHKVFDKTRFGTFPKPAIIVDKILNALKEFWSDDAELKRILKTPEFAWAYQEAAAEISGATGVEIKSAIEELSKLPNAAAEASSYASGGKWTLRHYNTEEFPELRTNIDLVHGKEIDPAKSNTRSKDYAYGTPGFTFFLIAINGKIPHRGFLKNCKYYYEIDLDAVTEDIWIGGDIINAKKGETRITYKGTGSEIKQFLLKQKIRTVEELDQMFGEQFEVKYPGNVRTIKENWHKVDEPI